MVFTVPKKSQTSSFQQYFQKVFYSNYVLSIKAEEYVYIEETVIPARVDPVRAQL